MSTIRKPVGPQPSGVYWRRRLLAVFGLIAIIAIIVLIVVRPGSGGTPAGSSTPPASDATDAEPPVAPTPTAVEGAPCDPAVVSVVAATDTNSYAAGQLPQLSFAITNTSGTSCSFNVGTTQQTFVITSGEEQYWSSKDCETGPIDSDLLLEPNTPVTSAAIPWDRTRSSTSTCDSERPAVPAGGATFNLMVTVGTAAESALASFILN